MVNLAMLNLWQMFKLTGFKEYRTDFISGLLERLVLIHWDSAVGVKQTQTGQAFPGPEVFFNLLESWLSLNVGTLHIGTSFLQVGDVQNSMWASNCQSHLADMRKNTYDNDIFRQPFFAHFFQKLSFARQPQTRH